MAAEALLSSLLGLLFLGLLLPAHLTGGVGSLNLEELSEMRYGIQILPLPVMGGQSQASDVVVVSSKYKQRYECRLPAGAIHFQREREEETPAYQGPGIPELLSPMRDAPCLLKTKDWWTYEFCYGRHIQQYHMEDSEIKGDVLYLGYYQSAFNWDDETAKASKQHRLKRYHSQTYGNGSKCDLNGKPREAEVRFLCDEGAGISGDYIDRVDEPFSCSYVLSIRTSRLCPHPLLRPPASAAPQAILCHPALQPDEYMAYLQRQAESKQHEEKVTEEVQDTDHQVWSGSKAAGAPPKKEDVSPTKEDKESEFWKMLQEPEEQATGTEEAQAGEQDLNHEAAADPAPAPPTDFQNNVQVKLIRSPADLIRLIEELKGAEKGKPSVRQEQPGDDTTEAPQREAEAKGKGGEPRGLVEEEDGDEEEEDEDEDEQQLLGEFEKELEGMLLPSDRERLRSEVKAGMERELENIIQETEKELDPEGLRKESEREQAILALTSTLDKLIKRLQESQSPELVQKYKKRRVVPQKPPPSPHPTEEEPEHRVRVRVTKLRHGGPNQDLTVLEMNRENPQLKQIEGLVTEVLEREGLTAEGKIEIKIVRPGAEGKEEDTRWLTDEDTRNLKEIFFNILVQGAEEANKERQRQSELESNYRRVWGSPGGEDTGDLDEFDF
ncbi:protein OS-9 precursor [Rattus norvegicus]|uniref:Protein OS-9 n=2 Tax=Rattus norvegicus TaxID=10116 RepID=OS9_RAT|nr:protein OS-9 precursor [Rattus norvegicus]Q5RKH6.1 RecName: Full=Protein OS-9; Flags: Precursor [Rattus norvegicus]AAH85907.1 Amplified in osteosarcoma [Rattus norvegicus]|eukprot:NP_001007266.1 protein OS-9 precursor [Rattus norvegicus]